MSASKIKLGYRERDQLFKKEFTQLKSKIVFNWLEVILLFGITLFISLKLLEFIAWESHLHPILISLATGILLVAVFCYFRKNQLVITRFDKEHLYKKISDKLIDESKKQY